MTFPGVPADSAGTPWAGRDLKSNPFAGDDGSPDPTLVAALAAYEADPTTTRLEAVVAALAPSRVLVPIVAELEQGGEGDFGQQVDKEASAGIVALEAPDGRRALPVFSSVATLSAWRADARPTPTQATRAALSAVAEGWALLVIDPGGPITALLPRPAVWAIAQGLTWAPAVRDGVVDQDIADEIAAVLAPIEHVGRAHAEAGRSAEVAVVLGLNPGLNRAGLDAVLGHVNAALAASSLISERVDALELRIGRA